MKFNLNINFPQKSILGFTVLSSLQSSFFCYLLLIMARSLNPFFGSQPLQVMAGSLFNLVLNLSIVILITNLFIKRKELNHKYFILLNSLLFYVGATNINFHYKLPFLIQNSLIQSLQLNHLDD